MYKSKYIESETDDEYLNFCNFESDSNNVANDTSDLNNNNTNTDLNLVDDNCYEDESNLDDDDLFFDDQRKWDLDEKLNIISKYNSNFVKYLEAKGQY